MFQRLSRSNNPLRSMIKLAHILYLLALCGGVWCFTNVSFAQNKLEVSTSIESNLGQSVQSHLASWTKTDKASLSLVKEPVYQSAQPEYGKVIVGNSASKKEIAVVIDEIDGKPARIYVDANNNRDLTDDGAAEWTPNESGVLFKSITIDATITVDGKDQIVKLPYGFIRFTDKVRKHAGVFYGCEYGRSGTVKVRDQQYKFVAMTASSQGLFSNPADIRFIIDEHQTGKLDTSKDSKQSYTPGQIFLLDGEAYKLSGASEIGDK